jgi:chromosome segregation ATPase
MIPLLLQKTIYAETNTPEQQRQHLESEIAEARQAEQEGETQERILEENIDIVQSAITHYHCLIEHYGPEAVAKATQAVHHKLTQRGTYTVQPKGETHVPNS